MITIGKSIKDIVKNAECFFMNRDKDSKYGLTVSTSSISMNKELLSSLLYKQVISADIKYFITLHFTEWNEYHMKMDIDTIRSYWDINAIRKTCKHIKNLIYDAFDKKRRSINLFFFDERHKNNDPDKAGKFHIHFLMTDIPDTAIDEPNRTCKYLMGKDNERGNPIENSVYSDIEEVKVDLLNACIRQAEQIGNHKPSVNIQVIDKGDEKKVLDYCLKQVYNDSKNLLEVIDFQNSNFYKPE